jgi:hypothetical protein
MTLTPEAQQLLDETVENIISQFNGNIKNATLSAQRIKQTVSDASDKWWWGLIVNKLQSLN